MEDVKVRTPHINVFDSYFGDLEAVIHKGYRKKAKPAITSNYYASKVESGSDEGPTTVRTDIIDIDD